MNFEKNIKNIVENFELDHDVNSAWESMNKKLDAIQTNVPSTPKNSSFTKLFLGGISALIIIVLGIYFSNDKPLTESQKSKPNNTNVVTTKTEVKALASNHVDKPIENKSTTEKNIQKTITNKIQKTELSPVNVNLAIKENHPEIIINENTSSEKENILIGKIQKTIVNNDFVTKNVTKENKEETSLSKTENIHFDVQLDPNVDFSKGLPMYNLNINTKASNYLIKNKYAQQNCHKEQTCRLPFFEAGKQEIEIVSIDESFETKKIVVFIPENYSLNLGGGNNAAFDPNANDERARTFLPIGLTVRKTPFTMLIIDPTNGNVIYSTNSIDEPWNGIDSKTNQLVPMNKTYIWKVIMFKPMQGEKSEYKGTVTYLLR